LVREKRFDYKGAESILIRKGLLSEIDDVLKKITSLTTGIHDIISGSFGLKGWNIKVNLLKGTDYQQDAFKQKVMLEIDIRSVLDSVQRNFLRAQELYNRKTIEVLVQIVCLDREPKFNKMKRDINAFKSVLTVPIYLIGLG